MSLKNTRENFGWVSICLHWIMAIALIAMYFVGDWMVDLDYYDTWYKDAPDYHRAVGVIIGALMIFRLLWNASQAKPKYLGDDKAIVKKTAQFTHIIFYIIVFIMVVSGYLITTAKGQGVDVFGLFEVPALLADSKDRGELAGDIHEWLGLTFILLVLIHALAALLHHFKHKDRTLKRMLGVRK